MRKRYSWGFHSIKGAEVSIISSGPESLGEIKVSGKGDSLTQLIWTLEGAYDMDGHLLGNTCSPIFLSEVVMTHLKQFRPYPAHLHPLPKPDRYLPTGFIN